MWKLWIGVAFFAGPHMFATIAPAARDALKSAVGPGAYRGIYSILGLLGVVLMALGYLDGRAVGADVYYQPMAGAKHITMLLALAGFILIAASHGKGYIKTFVKHPMSLGVALWSAGHLLANGEKAVVVIFGGLLLVAVFDIVFSLARGKGPTHQPRLRSDIIAVAAGTVVYAVLLFGFHPYILQVPVI